MKIKFLRPAGLLALTLQLQHSCCQDLVQVSILVSYYSVSKYIMGFMVLLNSLLIQHGELTVPSCSLCDSLFCFSFLVWFLFGFSLFCFPLSIWFPCHFLSLSSSPLQQNIREKVQQLLPGADEVSDDVMVTWSWPYMLILNVSGHGVWLAMLSKLLLYSVIVEIASLLFFSLLAFMIMDLKCL